MLANALAEGLPADGVITGTARIDGRTVAVMANDSTVKAGSWGAGRWRRSSGSSSVPTELGVPMVWLVDLGRGTDHRPGGSCSLGVVGPETSSTTR